MDLSKMLPQKHLFIIGLFFLCSLHLTAQQWVDTAYAIESMENIPYGTVRDFAGNERTLMLDLSLPVNDSVPECGRPLIVAIHGGAFIAGDKSNFFGTRIREDFARRGYVAVSVDYRLGQFHTSQPVSCAVSGLGVEWDCFNMADTSEWYRAYFRGVQDVNGAIRYLVNHADHYQINPEQVFLTGESAGGFIALGAGFIDDESEVLQNLTASMPSIAAPNTIYEAPCIQGNNLDTSIASMELSRPDLGSFQGTLHIPVDEPFQVKGVGNFYGAVFNNIFYTHGGEPPALYMYHQPNDLLVPFRKNKVLAGYSTCASQFPFFCPGIINRPVVWGSAGIRDMVDEIADNQVDFPTYFFDATNNTANCALQIANPSLQGHAIDNFWLRTTNMAAFFAAQMDTCLSTSTRNIVKKGNSLRVYPNPIHVNGQLIVQGSFLAGEQIQLFDRRGFSCFTKEIRQATNVISIDLSSINVSGGLFMLVKKGLRGIVTEKLVIQE